MVCNAGLAAVCHEHRIPLIVDEAHGGHFAFAEQFPQVLACVGPFAKAMRSTILTYLIQMNTLQHLRVTDDVFLHSLL